MRSTSSTTRQPASSLLTDIAERWTPHAYQLHAVKFLLTHGAAALFLDPGLGKTSIVLKAFQHLLKAGTSERMLVVAPLRVCYLVWPAEAQKWADFQHLRVEVLHGPKKQQALEREADVYVINPEGLEWLFSEGRFKKLGADLLVVDESSKFKHTNTRRFKMLKPFLPKFSRRWILTGTPAPNGLMDLFGQVFLLDLGRALGQFITRFRDTFFNQVGFEYRLKVDGAERIHEAIKPLALRLRDEDHLELPKIVVNDIRVVLPPKARAVYDDMEQRMFAELDAGEVTAVSAGVASMKCRQIANGGIYRDRAERAMAKTKREEWALIHDAKTDALEDLVEELAGQPLLIAYEFNHDLERLRARFGKDLPYIGAGVSPKQTAELEAAWNRGELPIMAGHPASIGHGLNLQRAGNHVAWYSITWDLELYDQFLRRVRRQGNKHTHVFLHRFIASQTVDELVVASLRFKDRTQTTFLDALSTYRKTRVARN